MRTDPITIEADPQRRVVRLRVRGNLEQDAARRAVFEAARSHPGYHRLWDFREADLTAWTAQDMRSLAEAVAEIGEAGSSVRVAALVSRDVEFGIARMYETLSGSRLGAETAVFRDESEAQRWVETGE